MLFLTQNREVGKEALRRLTSSAHQLVGDRGLCAPMCVGAASPSEDPHFFLGFPPLQLWVLSCPQLSRDILSSSHVSNFEFLVGFDWSLRAFFTSEAGLFE